MSVQLSLSQHMLTTAPPEVLVFLIQHLGSQSLSLQTALAAQEARYKDLEETHKITVANYRQSIHDIGEQLEDAEQQARSSRGDLERVMASNRRLEEENNILQHEVDEARIRWCQQEVTGQ